MSYTSTALHVAHGNGLPVPLKKVRHDPRPKVSSAPAFLRRTAEELAALDAAPIQPATKRPITHGYVGTPRGRELTLAQERVIVDEYLAGDPVATVSRRHKIGEDRLERILKRHGHKVRPRGGAQGAPLDAEAIVADYKAGMSQKDIAAKYKVWARRIRLILHEHPDVVIPRNGKGKP